LEEFNGIGNHLTYIFFIMSLNVRIYFILSNSCSFIMFLQSEDEEGLEDEEGTQNSLINF
jgi:hypothetical protein